MVDSFCEMGESFVCCGRETVSLWGVSSLGILVSLIWLSIVSSPVCLASSSSESSSASGSLSELALSAFAVLVPSMSKMWTLVKGCRNRGSPESESCAI